MEEDYLVKQAAELEKQWLWAKSINKPTSGVLHFRRTADDKGSCYVHEGD